MTLLTFLVLAISGNSINQLSFRYSKWYIFLTINRLLFVLAGGTQVLIEFNSENQPAWDHANANSSTSSWSLLRSPTYSVLSNDRGQGFSEPMDKIPISASPRRSANGNVRCTTSSGLNRYIVGSDGIAPAMHGRHELYYMYYIYGMYIYMAIKSLTMSVSEMSVNQSTFYNYKENLFVNDVFTTKY